MGRLNTQAAKLYKLIAAPLIAVALLLVNAVPVFAVADPDSLTIESVQVVRHVVETNDFALAVHYNIGYSSLPTETSDELFHFKAYSAAGVLISTADPYPYNDRGFGEGIVLYYWEAASAPTWNSAIELRITGNPVAAWAGAAPEVTYTLTTADYSAVTTQLGNQDILYNYIIEAVGDLEIAWGIVLLTNNDTRTVLNDISSSYIRGAIPGIQTMAPKLFDVMESVPDFSERSWTTTLFDTYQNRWTGTPVQSALSGIGRLTGDGDNWQWATGVMMVLLLVAFFILSHKWFSETRPALAAGMNILVGGAVMGFVSPLLIALPTLLAALFIGYALIFRNSS